MKYIFLALFLCLSIEGFTQNLQYTQYARCEVTGGKTKFINIQYEVQNLEQGDYFYLDNRNIRIFWKGEELDDVASFGNNEYIGYVEVEEQYGYTIKWEFTKDSRAMVEALNNGEDLCKNLKIELNGQPVQMPSYSSVLASALVPHLGHNQLKKNVLPHEKRYRKRKDQKDFPYIASTIGIWGLWTSAGGLKILSDNQYQIHRTTDDPTIYEDAYNKANRLHKTAYVTFLLGTAAWSYNLYRVNRKVGKKRNSVINDQGFALQMGVSDDGLLSLRLKF